MIGSFIYPYVNWIMKQLPDLASSRALSENELSALTAKVTGMIIEIPSMQQVLLACQTLDVLANKSREAVLLIRQAEA